MVMDEPPEDPSPPMELWQHGPLDEGVTSECIRVVISPARVQRGATLVAQARARAVLRLPQGGEVVLDGGGEDANSAALFAQQKGVMPHWGNGGLQIPL